GLIGSDIHAGQYDLDGAVASDQARQLLGAGSTREDAQRHLHLVDLRFSQHTKAHVESHRELAAAATDAALDLRDGHLVHRAHAVAHVVILVGGGSFAACRLVDGELEDRAYVEVRQKKIGIRALQDKDQAVLVRLDLSRHATEFGVERKRYDVDGRSIYSCGDDLAIASEPDQLVSFVSHNSFLVVDALLPKLGEIQGSARARDIFATAAWQCHEGALRERGTGTGFAYANLSGSQKPCRLRSRCSLRSG